MSSRRRKPNDSNEPSLNPEPLAADDIGGEEIRDDEGLLVDEYTSEAYDDPEALDALDVPMALDDESVLDQIADGGDGIEEVELSAGGAAMDTVDTGARRPPIDMADMGLGAEPRTPEELADAAIGHELRGRGAVTRDDELHGERLLDAPDGDAD